MEYLSNRLIKDIKMGGLIIAPHRSGKTVAILSILQTERDYVLSCYSSRYADELRKRFPSVKDKIYGPNIKSIVGIKKRVIIDECFYHPIWLSRGNHGVKIHCSLSSYGDDVVVYNNKGRKIRLNRGDYWNKNTEVTRESCIKKFENRLKKGKVLCKDGKVRVSKDFK